MKRFIKNGMKTDREIIMINWIVNLDRLSFLWCNRYQSSQPVIQTFRYISKTGDGHLYVVLALSLLVFLLGIVTVFLLWQSATHIASLERTQRQEAEAATEALWGAASAAARAAVMDGDIGSRDRALEAIQSASQHLTRC